MRVLLLADANSPHVQSWTRALAPELSQLVLYSFAKPDRAWHEDLANVELASLGISRTSIARSSLDPRKLRYLLARRELSGIVARFEPDLVHAHYVSSYGVVGALLDRHPLLVSAWGSDVFRFAMKSFVHRRLARFVLGRADGVLATSRVLAEALRRHTRRGVAVLPFGVDVERFAPAQREPRSESAFTVGVVKHLEPEYGIDVLIRAFALLCRGSDRELRLAVAGDGSERERCRRLVASLELDGAVDLLGRIEHASVPGFLARCDVVVNPSRFESFGVSVLEAGACGLPVVATRVGGVPEIVEDEKTGLLVPPDDTAALAGAIGRLIERPELRSKLGSEARRRVVEHYDLRRLAREQLRLYREAVERSQTPSAPAVAKSRISGRTGIE